MFHAFWLVRLSLVIGFLWWSRPASALTPEEILKLKAAGVSEKTIQMMLRNESENSISQEKLEQGYATDHMGTWKLRDGRTITSTGKRQLPLHYPTEYPPASPYVPYIYPHVGIPSVKTWQRSSSQPPVWPEPPGNPSRSPRSHPESSPPY